MDHMLVLQQTDAFCMRGPPMVGVMEQAGSRKSPPSTGIRLMARFSRAIPRLFLGASSTVCLSVPGHLWRSRDRACQGVSITWMWFAIVAAWGSSIAAEQPLPEQTVAETVTLETAQNRLKQLDESQSLEGG